jgi:hypothetical protein
MSNENFAVVDSVYGKFILPKKLSSAREIEHISSVEDMSVALLSCLLPEVEMLSTTVNLSPVKESIKKQRDEFIKPQLQFNNMEASFLVSMDGIKKYGFDLTKTGAEHLGWLSLMSINREIYVDDNAIPGYCFYWADNTEIGGHKQSNNDEFNRPDNFERHKIYTTDIATKKITKKQLSDYKEVFKPFINLLKNLEHNNRELYYKYILKNISKIF